MTILLVQVVVLLNLYDIKKTLTDWGSTCDTLITHYITIWCVLSNASPLCNVLIILSGMHSEHRALNG